MRSRLLVWRIALFQIGFGSISVLVLGILNRVMFAEIGLPATVIGILLAIPSLVSPLRLWVGYLSDSHPIGGYRRFPYLLLGTVVAALGVLCGTLGALWASRAPLLGILVAVVAFSMYGMGKNAMATTSQALIADIFDERQRPRATAVLKAAFILGIIGASVLLGNLVDPYSPRRLLGIVIVTGLVAVILSVLGTAGLEPVGRDIEALCRRTRELRMGQILSRALRAPQVRRFFFFIGTTLLATLSQDIFLEPYAARVLHMSVGQTTRLSMYWGIGTLTALLTSGLWLVNRMGRKRVAAVGLAIVASAFGGLIVAGAIGNTSLLIAVVLVLGVGSGIAGSGALTLMIDFTTPELAGTMVGTWTIAHQLAEVIGNVMGGVLVDSVFAISQSYLTAFGTVFTLEIVAALAGLALLPRINPAEFVRTGASIRLDSAPKEARSAHE
jgi:BCD family chlorophyll transporter-like MFS transporter